MNLVFSVLLSYCFFQVFSSPDYKVAYRLTYSPDSTRAQLTKSENVFLFIKGGGQSYYASENLLKKDSISVLIKKGVLSEYDVIGDPGIRFSTKFAQFIQKEYSTKTNQVYETIGLLHYNYPIQSDLKWEIGTERDSLSGYACTKATTNYAGREYEAWFTPEIPIPDGPYVFRGLPGLIVKVGDTQNHYVFTLERFGEYNGKITEAPTYRKQQPIEIDQSRAFALREDYRKDPIGALSRTAGISMDNATFQQHGSSERVPAKLAVKDQSWNNNPLELK